MFVGKNEQIKMRQKTYEKTVEKAEKEQFS